MLLLSYTAFHSYKVNTIPTDALQSLVTLYYKNNTNQRLLFEFSSVQLLRCSISHCGMIKLNLEHSRSDKSNKVHKLNPQTMLLLEHLFVVV